MPDIENVAVAEPALARRRPIYFTWEEKVRDFFARYKTANHGSGEEDDVVAVAAEPQEHTRWILIFLVTFGSVFAFFASVFLVIHHDGHPSRTVMIEIFIWQSIAAVLAHLSAFLVSHCQRGFQDEDSDRLVDSLLQL